MPSAVPPSFGVCRTLVTDGPGFSPGDRRCPVSLALCAGAYWVGRRAWPASFAFGPEAPGSIHRRRHPGFHQPPGLSADARRVLVPFTARIRISGGMVAGSVPGVKPPRGSPVVGQRSAAVLRRSAVCDARQPPSDATDERGAERRSTAVISVSGRREWRTTTVGLGFLRRSRRWPTDRRPCFVSCVAQRRHNVPQQASPDSNPGQRTTGNAG